MDGHQYQLLHVVVQSNTNHPLGIFVDILLVSHFVVGRRLYCDSYMHRSLLISLPVEHHCCYYCYLACPQTGDVIPYRGLFEFQLIAKYDYYWNTASLGSNFPAQLAPTHQETNLAASSLAVNSMTSLKDNYWWRKHFMMLVILLSSFLPWLCQPLSLSLSQFSLSLLLPCSFPEYHVRQREINQYIISQTFWHRHVSNPIIARNWVTYIQIWKYNNKVIEIPVM